MARDKARDDKYFNCSQEHEDGYVSGLYEDKKIVSGYLKQQCESGGISYSTHMEVYTMIEADLGFPVPVS